MDILELKNVTKTFPGVIANDGVNLSVEKGEVHAVLGENGAGKSTLMNIIYGLYQPESGKILYKGKEVSFLNPNDAIDCGIGMVHQHFKLIPVMTVAENIILGSEPGNFIYDKKEAEEEIASISEEYKLDVDPTAKVENLSVGLQQRVEILKAFYRKAELLILDEPTAVLTPQETESLFKVIRGLKKDGITVIFISHKLDEVMEISDRITVMRDGKIQDTVLTRKTGEQELANLMVGREVVLDVNKKPVKTGSSKLNVQKISVIEDGIKKINNVSFDLHEGEIFGLAGIDGNGQHELAECLAGVRALDSGKIFLEGEDITGMSSRERHLQGISYIPQDRQQEGLVMNFNLAENIALKTFHHEPYSKNGLLNYKKINDYAYQKVREYDVKPPNINSEAVNLSGGNQQKIILAREIGSSPEVLIAVQPTRGMDVGAIEFIHEELLRLRAEGKTIFLISLELNEILSLSDRIGVIYDGQIMDIMDRNEADREKLGLLMLGKEIKSTG